MKKDMLKKVAKALIISGALGYSSGDILGALWVGIGIGVVAMIFQLIKDW